MNNIDGFCKKEQLAVIYKLLIADFRKISLSDSMAYLPLFYSLSSMCGIVGKIAIFLDLHLPKCILNARLMQLFNDKNNTSIVMNKHKISVIIPIYNCAEWIEKCVNSILNQKLPNSMNCKLFLWMMEVVIIQERFVIH